MRGALSFLFAALFLAIFPLRAEAKRARITIGFHPADKSSLLESNGKRLSDYVKKKTGLEVNSLVAKDYESLVEALEGGKVDFAFLPPFSFVKAEEKGNAKLLLKAVRRGQATYYSAIIVRTDSGIEKIEQLKGKKIAWVNKDSATGFLMPQAEMIRAKKIDPGTFFTKQRFEETHDELVEAVLHGTVDAGATWVNDPQGKYGAWHRYLRKPEELAQIKMIFVTSGFAGDALVASNVIWKNERAMVEKVAKVMQRMGEALDGQQILRDLYGIDKMVPATAKDYEEVRAAAKIVGPK